ncbi:MAG: hypothetical protein IKU42_07405 [Oscillospiraceae bacterium]|nr:hypothetical protein [Oscillospiraceae bacterium]
MEKLKNDGKIFAFGAVGYYLLETLWRGYSHWTMAAAGGICLFTLMKIFSAMKKAPLYFKAIIGGITITAVELVFGIVFNLKLGMGIWDYSEVKYNILGQICPVYSFIWCGISFLVSLYQKMNSEGKIRFIKKAF